MPFASLVLSCFLVAQAPVSPLGAQATSPSDLNPPASIGSIPDPASRAMAPIQAQPQGSVPEGNSLSLPITDPPMTLGAGQAQPLSPRTETTSPLNLPFRAQNASAPASGKPAEPAGATLTPAQALPSRQPSAPSAPASPKEPPKAKAEVPEAPAKTESARRPLPPDMVSQILKLPQGTKLAGRPLTLLDALANAFDRTQRLAVTHAYWHLANALAEYNLCVVEHEQLQRLQVHDDDKSLLRTAQASAEASLRAAEVAVVAAQYDLAEAVGLSGQETLPLPADLPHVGPYRTNFEVVAARQPLPPRTRLIDRMLPIRRKAVDVWALAVQAAEDAVQAITEAYRQSTTDLATVLEYQSLLGRRQRSFMASVCDYNHDIADYAITVAGPEIASPALVSMLIKTNDQVSPRSIPSGSGEVSPLRRNPGAFDSLDSGVQPAALNVPVPDEALDPMRPMAGQPTLAPPRDRLEPARRNVPTLAPPRDQLKSPEAGVPTLAPPRDQWTPPTSGQPTLAPPREQPSATETTPPAEAQPADTPPGPSESEQPTSLTPETPAEPSEATQSVVPVSPNASSMILRTAHRQVVNDSATTQPVTGLYPGLVDATSGVRAKRLAEALFASRTSSFAAGKAIELRDCLREARTGNRRALIGAYWQARQRAAEYQALAMHNDWLTEILPFTLQRRSQLGGPEEMLRLRAAQLAVKANLLDAQLQCLEAQYELTEQAGAALDSSWLVPLTAPHAGPYQLRLEAQPPQLVAALPVKRLAATVPALSANVQDRADAVVQADVARVEAAAAYQTGRQTLDYALTAINLQTAETRAFLATVTEYNGAIASYVLTITPPTVPGDKLVEALVVMK